MIKEIPKGAVWVGTPTEFIETKFAKLAVAKAESLGLLCDNALDKYLQEYYAKYLEKEYDELSNYLQQALVAAMLKWTGSKKK